MELSIASRLVSSPTTLQLRDWRARIPHRFLSIPPLQRSLPSLRRMDSHHSQLSLSSSSLPQNNGSPPSTVTSPPIDSYRIGEVKRVTKETNVGVKINLDGTGVADSSTGIPFLDHMLDQLASHGLFDVHVRATGDIHIDDHHTNEDVALAIGTVIIRIPDY